jgi:hypothetical protein
VTDNLVTGPLCAVVALGSVLAAVALTFVPLVRITTGRKER